VMDHCPRQTSGRRPGVIAVVSQARPDSTRDSLHRVNDDVPVEAT
jgi:hypothetical protein